VTVDIPVDTGGVFDFNPTEGSGTVITEKNGSGIDMTTNGTWTGVDSIKYDIVSIFNFTHGRANSDLFTLAPHSSMLLFVKIPSSFIVGTTGWLCGRKPGPISGALLDHEVTVDSSGKFNATIRTTAGAVPPNTDVTVTSTTVAAADGEYFVGMTHDGVTLKLWVNGVVEDSASAGDSEPPPTGTYVIVGGGSAPFASEVPLDDMEIGRFIVANRGLTAGEMAVLYGEYQAQYPGLP
jgi:hypothetical protein